MPRKRKRKQTNKQTNKQKTGQQKQKTRLGDKKEKGEIQFYLLSMSDL